MNCHDSEWLSRFCARMSTSRTMKSLNGRVINENVSLNQLTAVSIGSANDVPNEIGNSFHPATRPTTVAATNAATATMITLRGSRLCVEPGSEINAMLTRSNTNATATTARLTTSPRPGDNWRTVWLISWPRPPAPTRVAMTTIPNAIITV